MSLYSWKSSEMRPALKALVAFFGGVDSDPDHCMYTGEKKTEGHGSGMASVWWFSRREKFYSFVFDILVPWILQKNIEIECYVLNSEDPPTGRDEDIAAKKMVRKSRMSCLQFLGVHGIRLGLPYRQCVSQVQSQEHESMPNRPIHSI